MLAMGVNDAGWHVAIASMMGNGAGRMILGAVGITSMTQYQLHLNVRMKSVGQEKMRRTILLKRVVAKFGEKS